MEIVDVGCASAAFPNTGQTEGSSETRERRWSLSLWERPWPPLREFSICVGPRPSL